MLSKKRYGDSRISSNEINEIIGVLSKKKHMSASEYRQKILNNINLDNLVNVILSNLAGYRYESLVEPEIDNLYFFDVPLNEELEKELKGLSRYFFIKEVEGSLQLFFVLEGSDYLIKATQEQINTILQRHKEAEKKFFDGE